MYYVKPRSMLTLTKGMGADLMENIKRYIIWLI
jgi:hypothetical protein